MPRLSPARNANDVLVLTQAEAIGLVGLMGLVSQLIAGFNLALTLQSIVRVLVASLVIGLVAVSIPTWQMARLDPAQVFRN